MILFYEASIRSWRCYKAKEAKGQKSIRSYIKYNRAMKDMEEIRKITKDLKLIEDVVETYGQMMFQLIILYRITTLSADDFHFMGLFVVRFKNYIWVTLSISFLGMLATVRGYNNQHPWFVQLILITVKILIYCVCFANQPHWIIIALLIKFLASVCLNRFLQYHKTTPDSARTIQDKMIHSLVCVILPISMSPAYKPSFFDNPDFKGESDQDAQKQARPSDNGTKWWMARETAAHLILYFLECTCVIAYATSMFNNWTFKDQPYEKAYQEFWNTLPPGNWWPFKSLFDWAWLGLFFFGIFLGFLAYKEVLLKLALV